MSSSSDRKARFVKKLKAEEFRPLFVVGAEYLLVCLFFAVMWYRADSEDINILVAAYKLGGFIFLISAFSTIPAMITMESPKPAFGVALSFLLMSLTIWSLGYSELGSTLVDITGKPYTDPQLLENTRRLIEYWSHGTVLFIAGTIVLSIILDITFNFIIKKDTINYFSATFVACICFYLAFSAMNASAENIVSEQQTAFDAWTGRWETNVRIFENGGYIRNRTAEREYSLKKDEDICGTRWDYVITERDIQTHRTVTTYAVKAGKTYLLVTDENTPAGSGIISCPDITVNDIERTDGVDITDYIKYTELSDSV